MSAGSHSVVHPIILFRRHTFHADGTEVGILVTFAVPPRLNVFGEMLIVCRLARILDNQITIGGRLATFMRLCALL